MPALVITPSQVEVSENAGWPSFSIYRDGDLSEELRVPYRLAGSATHGDDYGHYNMYGSQNGAEGELVFSSGSSSGYIGVWVTDDTLPEPNETVILTLYPDSTDPNQVQSSDAITILDNDGSSGGGGGGSPTYTLHNGVPEVGEQGEHAYFVLDRAGDLSQGEWVYYEFAYLPDGASFGSDYTLTNPAGGYSTGSRYFAPGQSRATFEFTTIDDTIDEPNEIIRFSVNTPNHQNLTADITIVDNDPPPPLTLTIYGGGAISEDGGSVTYSIYRDQHIDQEFRATFHFSGTAETGVDHTHSVMYPDPHNDPWSLYFAPGHSSAYVTVNALQDTRLDPNETITVEVAYDDGVTGVRSVVGEAVTIIDDETPAAPDIAVRDGQQNELHDGMSAIWLSDLTVGAEAAHAITVRNDGEADLTLDPSQFVLPSGVTIDADTETPITVAPGSSFGLNLRVTPESSGHYYRQISLHNNDPDENPFDFWITGNANSPPEARDDWFQYSWSPAAIVLSPLINDTDADNDHLRIVNVVSLGHGAASHDDYNIYYYPPVAAAAAGDGGAVDEIDVNIRYEIMDSNGATSFAHVQNVKGNELYATRVYSRGNDDPTEAIYETAQVEVKLIFDRVHNQIKLRYKAVATTDSRMPVFDPDQNGTDWEFKVFADARTLYLQTEAVVVDFSMPPPLVPEGAPGVPLEYHTNNPETGVAGWLEAEIVLVDYNVSGAKSYSGKAVVQNRTAVYEDAPPQRYAMVRQEIAWQATIAGDLGEERIQAVFFTVAEIPMPAAVGRIPTPLRVVYSSFWGREHFYKYPPKSQSLPRNPENPAEPLDKPLLWDVMFPLVPNSYDLNHWMPQGQ